jgi:predicted Zn-dependent peptidase
MNRHFGFTLLGLLPLCLAGQNLKEFEKNVTEFTLGNGLHWIVLQRHAAPVASFHMYVNAGSVDDPSGKTGIAHMFEHMIGKGTSSVGSKNWAIEKPALAAVESAYDKLEAERRKGPRADQAKVKQLEKALSAAIEKANASVEPNAFVRVIEEQGANGFNAGTGTDSTTYFYSLPSNRLELWFLLQSEWLRQPIYREFYKERDVVRNERRMRMESSPQGKLLEALLSTAFAAHPYGRSPVGWASDIENLRVADAAEFHRKYYVPGNVTIGIAGDVDPQAIRLLADKYFGPIPAGELPPPVITVEPPQEGERRVAVQSPAQPFLTVAYHRPDMKHPDDAPLDVLGAILSSGRTSTLYKELVRDKKIALVAQAISGFPGSKYPTTFVFFSVPSTGHTVEENEKAWYGVVERMQKDPVDKQVLDRVKIKVRAGLIRQLDSNSGLAGQLAAFHAGHGDWRKMFTQLEEIERVTADDVRRVAREYLKETARTVVWTYQPKQAEKKEAE